VSWLLSVPGGSRTLLEAAVPYSEEALGEYLGRRPESFCSAATTRALAERALERAGWLAGSAHAAALAGVACTASLRSDRPKRGDHRFHIAIATARRTLTWSLTLTKEARDREGEETVADLVLLNALAEVCGVAERVMVPLLPGEEVVKEEFDPGRPLAELLAGRLAALWVRPDGRMRPDGPAPGLLLPGSFNPLHEGHCALAATAARLAGAPAAFELSATNADKPALPDEEVRRRLGQFAWRAPVWLTRAPTFAEKAALFPGCVFVVGADTAERIVQPRFYGDSAERMAEALGLIRKRGCRFLVAGRVGAEGRFVELAGLELPMEHADLFAAIPGDVFRVDISSTELRG
jgi:nicotinic acid mononucleotide adenylyltransferase